MFFLIDYTPFGGVFTIIWVQDSADRDLFQALKQLIYYSKNFLRIALLIFANKISAHQRKQNKECHNSYIKFCDVLL